MLDSVTQRSRAAFPKNRVWPRVPLVSTPITTVTVTRPSLDDVFMTYTGTTISDAEKPKAGMR